MMKEACLSTCRFLLVRPFHAQLAEYSFRTMCLYLEGLKGAARQVSIVDKTQGFSLGVQDSARDDRCRIRTAIICSIAYWCTEANNRGKLDTMRYSNPMMKQSSLHICSPWFSSLLHL